MIKNRPAHLLAQADYKQLPAAPFSVNWDSLPELLRVSLGPLGGIQPVTGAMAKAAGGELHDMPCEAEVELFKKAGTQFQMISIVLSLAHIKNDNGALQAIPYALTAVPASKRNAVDQRDISLIAKLDLQNMLRKTEPCYTGFDPFTGEWGLFGPLSLFIREQPFEGFPDELGVVIDSYFLAVPYDAGDVLEFSLKFPNPKSEEKYKKHRARLLYTPFGRVEARRLWGAQSPIELFLFQELLRRGTLPQLQILFFDDGSIHPSLHHLWKNMEFRHSPGTITESDLYFPEQKLAVFCDSARWHRGGRAQAKDQAVSAQLNNIGIKSVRVPGKLIVEDLKAAADLVTAALNA